MKFGASEADAIRFVDAAGDGEVEVYEVLPENHEVIGVFSRVWPRCIRNPFTGERVAMDCLQAESTLRLMGIPAERWPRLFNLLLACEEEALTLKKGG